MVRYTFDRTLRLLSRDQYDKVFKSPVRASTPNILVLAAANDGQAPRLGLIIPKKVLKRAVWRNRIKRVIRETFRLNQHQLPNIDIVIVAKSKIGELSNSELSMTLVKLWQQVSLRLTNRQ